MVTSPLDRIANALGRYVDPNLGMPLADAGAVESVTAGPQGPVARIVLGYPVGGYAGALEGALDAHLAAEGVEERPVYEIVARIPAFVADPRQRPLPQVANVIAVASGKGGVGKSTVAANLALALAALGARAGLLDADVYGPSMPRMMGLQGERPTTADGKTLEPPRGHGVPVMSIGFMVDADQPMAWRGPMATQALAQMLADTRWGELDYLVVDMPPGTGDIQLTLTQRVPVSGAVIVTTPQEIALLDARKGLQMFRKVGVPVLGIVENMGLHRCPACGHESHIFDAGGGRALAERYGTALLGELPLDGRIREQADSGRPTVVADPGSPAAQAFLEIARRAAGALAAGSIKGVVKMPSIRIEGE
ncbi:MAG TPA: iron-sulfur cluster carrier protein ApbC [Steroidobacteraceae bacterium]|jgi:ATP-binding protein involved in chromosome partitioning|nr:iron-sulfur cluster carrier protein ApbC [Steroidobacteraceae bacterium]